MLAWLAVWSDVQTCIQPSWCHCHSRFLASVKCRLVLPFWYQLTRVVPDKGPLNGCMYGEKDQIMPVHINAVKSGYVVYFDIIIWSNRQTHRSVTITTLSRTTMTRQEFASVRNLNKLSTTFKDSERDLKVTPGRDFTRKCPPNVTPLHTNH